MRGIMRCVLGGGIGVNEEGVSRRVYVLRVEQ